jgi:hypothetical protein
MRRVLPTSNKGGANDGRRTERNCANFRRQAPLVSAAIACLEGRELDVMPDFDPDELEIARIA